MTAPIVLFTYSRSDHTRRTVESLLQNQLSQESDLIVFSDAPRTLDKQARVDEVRAYLNTITGFRSITIHHRPHNFGLARITKLFTAALDCAATEMVVDAIVATDLPDGLPSAPSTNISVVTSAVTAAFESLSTVTDRLMVADAAETCGVVRQVPHWPT